MPRKPKAKPVEEPAPSPPTKEEAKAQAKLLPFIADDDLAEIALAADPRLASLYLIAKKAAKKSVLEILQLLSSKEGEREDDIDRAIKELMLEKLKEEIEESKQLRQLLLPLILQSYQESKRQHLVQECVNQKLMAYMLQGQQLTPQVIQQAQIECSSQAQASSGLLSLIGLLGSPQSNVQPQSQDNSQVEVSENELGSI